MLSPRLLLVVAATLGATAATLFAARPGAAPLSAAPLSAAKAAGTKFRIDGGHSAVVFNVQHLGVSYSYGRFNRLSGSFTLDEAAPKDSSIEIVIDAASVDTGLENRDKHLRGSDFFNAEQFPEIRFASRTVKAKGERLEVAGELTLLGQKKPLTVEVEKVGEGDRGERFGYRAGFRTSFTIKRSDFGMNYMLDNNGLGDEVAIEVSIEGIRE